MDFTFTKWIQVNWPRALPSIKAATLASGQRDPGAPLDVNGKAVINGVSEASAAVLSDYYNGNSAWGIGVDDTAAANSSAFLYMELNGTEIGDITNVNNTGYIVQHVFRHPPQGEHRNHDRGSRHPHANPRRRLQLHKRPHANARARFHRPVALSYLSGSCHHQRNVRHRPSVGTSTPWAVDYGRLTPLLVTAIQDIANISSRFEQNLIAWLGNAKNGIGEFFAQVGNFQTTNTETSNASTTNTQTLCITNGSNDPSPLCITKSQLAALLSQTASAQTSESVSSSALQNPTPEPLQNP